MDEIHPMSQPHAAAPTITPEEALQKLVEGNQRFVSGQVRHAHQAADWRSHLTTGQHPFATILACSDSRVPPELVFDQGFGDLFVVRVAGNIIDSDILGSIGYGLIHLQTPLVVVMGHEGCGAVTAALRMIDGQAHETHYIAGLLNHIIPGLGDVAAELEEQARVSAAVEENVRQSARKLTETWQKSEVLKNSNILLKQAVYELQTGRVRFLD